VSTRLEQNKKPGVSYALTPEGWALAPQGSADALELPIIDVTHRAFAVSLTEAEIAARVAKALAEPQRFAKAPPFLRRALFALFLRKSILARGFRASEGSFLAGLSTYLLKLGPDNLGEAYATAIDRRIAASVPALSLRLRLQDMATLLAEALAPRLASRPGRPLRLVNIAGGPAMDSLNALILLRRDHPAALAGRRAWIDVLDQDVDGPAFGSHALAELLAPGAPLAGVDAKLVAIRANWRDTAPLRELLREIRAVDAVAAGSSEGGLFEYGSDEEIAANLACLRDEAPDDFVMTGSVTRADETAQRLRQGGRHAIRPRGLEVFRALAAKSGWRIARAIARPLSDQVALERVS
jgi:hypothetical protein